MKCIASLPRIQVPADVTMASLRLYIEIGKNDSYQTLFAPDFAFLAKQLALQEAYSFYKCFFADLKIPESRLKSLQLESSRPKTKTETLYKNIVTVFSIIHRPGREPFKLTVTEINDLVKLLYIGYFNPDQLQYRKVEKARHTLVANEPSSKREVLETLINEFQAAIKKNEHERSFLFLNFIVDYMNLDIYKFDDKDAVAVLIYYILCRQDLFAASRYVPFFGKVFVRLQEFRAALDRTRFNWNEGYAEIMPLHRMFLQLHRDLYNDLSDEARDYDYESKLEIRKSDYVENTIDKLPEVFSKEDIRLRHPLISDSTINRTLKRMQEENKIRPLGTGRSAKWIKLYKKEVKKTSIKQLNLTLEE
ncbi:MAG TPA: hypothetical protein DCR44_01480 [Acholeplasmatales bacterium]|nr:MAG: hypothetical protein A2Y16_06695 [Tenericutes bacterium GWF2_57_13]HAQ56067.1 hypothetical protein [Acholeplasmatales bacterium]